MKTKLLNLAILPFSKLFYEQRQQASPSRRSPKLFDDQRQQAAHSRRLPKLF